MTVVMPITRLTSETDKIYYESATCCYGTCHNKPIKSHTISRNYLYKLNNDLKEILTFHNSVTSLLTRKEALYKPIDQMKFSTFVGLCESHDQSLFKLIDLYDGKMDNEKAALIHYRNICYGINDIKKHQLRLEHLSKQTYVLDELPYDINPVFINMIKDGILSRRLEYCLKHHVSRKRQLEKIIESRNFNEIQFRELHGSLDNPIFAGRFALVFDKKHNLFNFPGYSIMPWITYMTLLTNTSNHLVFCWLKSDKHYGRGFKSKLKYKSQKDIIELLAYGYSDAFAVDKDFYNRYQETINKICRGLRMH